MWKRLDYAYLTRPKLLLWLLLLVLLLLIGWQGLQLAKLGQVWQALPQRILATPLADYAEQAAIRAILADDDSQAQRFVNELTAAELISSAQLYGEEGRLLAQSEAEFTAKTKAETDAGSAADSASEETAPHAAAKNTAQKKPAPQNLATQHSATNADQTTPLTYVRPLYQDEQPVGFLRLQLANNPLAVAQQSIWQRLEHHLIWLLPLCLLLGLLLGIALQHWRQRRAQP